MKTIIKLLPFFLILFSCTETQNKNKKAPSKTEKSQPKKLPAKNMLVVEDPRPWNWHIASRLKLYVKGRWFPQKP